VSAKPCPLAWKAAALQDARLEGADLASFEDHVTRCADCRADWEAIAAVDEAARALPFESLAPLAHARQRAALLARANERFLRPPRRWRPWGLALLGAATVAAAAAYVVGRTPPLVLAREPSGLGAPRCEVVTSERALWRAQSDGTTARVDVADGEATLVVGELVAPQRALIQLPDGELDAATSRFTVDVALGRTRSVRVVEGHVVFRPRAAEPVVLGPRDGWPRSTAATARTPEDRVPAIEGVLPSVSAANGPKAPPPLSTASASSGSVATTTAARRARLASSMFDEAISSFVHASYAQADHELRDFIADYPDDSRCEDAAFLSAVARWRMGDVPGARARAASYLKAYPSGLRRAESQQIVDGAR